MERVLSSRGFDLRDYCIALKVKEQEESEVIQSILEMNLPSRIRIVVYVVKKSNPDYNRFPVNKLRNLAIVNIVTTHFLVFDMDMWPIRIPRSFLSFLASLYSKIMRIPQNILDSPSAAIIVPSFFLNKDIVLSQCKNLMDCAMLSERLFPVNRTSLLKCIQRGTCLYHKARTVTHVRE